MTRQGLVVAGTVFCAALAVYAGNLANGFAMDDAYNIVRNPDIRALSDQPAALLRPVGAASSSDYARSINTGYWRPIATLSYGVDHALFGLRAAGFHATNDLLHAATSALLALLLLGWLGLGPAWIGGLWFALHPVHSEAVDLVTYRTELLAALCCVAALYLHARDAGRRARWVAVAIAGLYAAGLGAKETAATLPAWLLLAEGLRERQRRPWWLLQAALGLVLLAWLAARAALHVTPSSVQFFAGLSPWQTACSVLKIYPTYLRLLVWPWPLTPFYDWTLLPPAASLADPVALLGLLLLLGTVMLVLRLGRTQPLMALGLGWWLVGLLPFAQIVALPVGAAERFLYLPSVGIALTLAAFVHGVSERVPQPWRRPVLLPIALVLGALAAATVVRNRDWHDDMTLQQATVQRLPQSFNGHHVLGQLYLRAGRLGEGLAQFDQAETLLPGLQQNALWRARALMKLGRFAAAEQLLAAIDGGRDGEALRRDARAHRAPLLPE